VMGWFPMTYGAVLSTVLAAVLVAPEAQDGR
jgi:hypothetical protein